MSGFGTTSPEGGKKEKGEKKRRISSSIRLESSKMGNRVSSFVSALESDVVRAEKGGKGGEKRARLYHYSLEGGEKGKGSKHRLSFLCLPVKTSM